MKTVNYDGKITRQVVFCIFLLIAIFLISIIVKEQKNIHNLFPIMVLALICFFILGMIAGYSSAIGEIKYRIFSIFNEAIKISSKGVTIITGKLIFVTEGIKLKGIVLQNDSLKVEDEENERNKYVGMGKNSHTLLIGDEKTLV